MSSSATIEKIKTMIIKNVKVKSLIFERDTEKIWPYTLPKLAATENEIHELEMEMRTLFPYEYRLFLGLANGYNSFFSITIFLGPIIKKIKFTMN